VLRAAVIGSGVMGLNHVRVLRDLADRVQLVGVADANGARLAEVRQRFAVPTFADLDELFEQARPDAVVVATPTATHHAVASRAIERGAHVLVEKPIAASVPEAKELVAAAACAGVVLAVGHIERFNPAVVELERRLDDTLGRMFMLHSRRQSPYPGRVTDVGVIADLATHELDMMRHLARSEVRHVQACSAQVLHPTSEDIVFGILTFGNGVLGILDVNWVTPAKVRDISVTGERGMFTVNYLTQELFFHTNAAEWPGPRQGAWTAGNGFGVGEGDMVRHHVEKREPLRDELLDFLEAIERGREPRVTGDDGLRALELALEISEKAASVAVLA
jgi:UDP-N-acetylglucosamine 3-dehydrogenase